MPDRTLVAHRDMRVAGNRNAVREVLQVFRRTSEVVPAPALRRSVEERGEYGVRWMVVLDIEERFRALQLRASRRKELVELLVLVAHRVVERGIRRLGRPALGADVARKMREPLEENELVALHFLDLNGLVLLVEELLPDALAVADERLFRGLLVNRKLNLRELGPMVEISVYIVVAGDEKLLDMTAVGALVVREHLVPDVCDALKLAYEPLEAEVARDNHAVHLLRIEPLERLAEVRALVHRGYVYVA